jgi:pSer/pThr/pTyr-binding forkhead associated (FHA) protein
VETVDPGLTNAVPVEIHEPIEKKGGAQPSQAGLILENEKIYSLNRAVTNIGRRSTNHLVVSDLRVSRNHAQVRLVNGRYMIFDAGSTGGTYINGERIQQSTLRPGDVISLAGVKLIFVVDERDDETNPIRTDTRPS